MADNRTKNTIRNIGAGLFNKIVSIILPFINRTAILWILGAEFTGLASLFASILHVLNLAELGFNTAIVYSLYKPMADRDEKKICETVSLFKKIYTIVGTIIFFGGLLLLPFLPHLIKGSYPSSINIYLLYILYLLNSSISYYLFAYKECLLIADQRKDIASNIRTIVEITKNVMQFIILLITKNFYMYLIVAIIGTIVSNVCIEVSTRKRYSFYKKINSKLKIPKELKKQVSGLMINKICDTFRNSFDSLIISSLFGLVATAMYSNYYYIYSSLYGIMLVICNSMGASVGNSIIKKTEEENYNNMETFYWIFTWILGITTVCLGCLYQPFMKLWVGKDLLLSNYNMLLFCIYYYLINMNNVRNQYISGTGIWWKLKKSYIIEAIANLVLNIVLGKFLGITGVIFATIITIFLFNYLQRNKVLFANYFKNESIFKFYKSQAYYFFVVLISFVISYLLCDLIHLKGILELIVNGCIAVIIPSVILFVCLRFSSNYQFSLKFIKNNLLRRFKYKKKIN